MRGWMLLVAIIVVAASFPALAQNPTVSNVAFVQGPVATPPGTQVTITYNLVSAGGNCTVMAMLSQNGGTTYPFAITTAVGNGIGTGVTAGTGKQIVWSVAADYPNLNMATARIKIIAILGTRVECVNNRTFTGSLANWATTGNWAYTATMDPAGAAGKLAGNNQNTLTQTAANQANALIVGTAYTVTYTVSQVSSTGFRVSLGTANGTTRNAVGTYTENITCAGNTTITFAPRSNNTRGVIDNISIRAGANDGQANSATGVLNTVLPTATINQAVGQADPASVSPINFTAVFSKVVTNFATGDVAITGTSGGVKTATVGATSPYNVAVTGMTTGGTVIANIAAGVCWDALGNGNVASTSTDNQVTWGTACTAATVTVVPSSQTVNTGGTGIFTATLGGTPPFTYEWRKNGTAIPTATDLTLTLSNVANGDQASYTFYVANACGNALSTPASTLRVSPAVTAVAVQSALTVRVTFSEAMGASAATALNYSVSGTGAGTLALHPNSAVAVTGSGNTQYDLTWLAPNEMRNGYDIIITVANALGSDGDAIGTAPTNAGTHVGGGIGVRPSLTLAQAGGQADPTSVLPINFTATFSENVSNFVPASVGVTASGAPSVTITPPAGPASVYTIAVSGVTDGNVSVNVPANGCADAAGNLNVASTNGDVTVRYDAVVPSVSSVAVQTWRTVAVTFSEPMGAGVMLATNYSISGGGGTLPLNPSIVAFVSGNTYLCTWPSGEMVEGGNVTITVVNAQDLSGHPMGAFNFATHVGGGIAPVHVTLQPVSRTDNFHAAGVTFMVAASGHGPITYQWQRGGADLGNVGHTTGVTTPILNISNADNSDEFTDYQCVVGSASGVAGPPELSGAASLSVNDPVITAISVTPNVVDPTDWVTASIEVGGSLPLSYVWEFRPAGTTDWIDIGITDATFSIQVDESANGDLRCIVTGSDLVPVTSDVIPLAVNKHPVIETQPVSLTLDPLGSATFSVVLSQGSEPLTYLWTKDGNPLSNNGHISGADTALLTIAATLLIGDQGDYRCLVSNSAGTKTDANALSDIATLTLKDPNEAPVITDPASLTTDYGTSAVFTVTATGIPEPTYRWSKGGTPLSDGGDIAGASTAEMTISNVENADEDSYACTATNIGGADTSIAAVLTVIDPIITIQPLSTEVLADSQADFTIAASGSATLSYQWRKGGLPLSDVGNISGATSAHLTIANCLSGDVGDYDCVITGGDGATSATVQLSVNDPAIVSQPLSWSGNAGTDATFTVHAEGTPPLSYKWMKDGIDLPLSDAHYSGVDTSVLTVLSVTLADEIQSGSGFSCLVTGLTSTESSPAYLYVNRAPVIGTQPDSQTVDTGQNVQFEVVLNQGDSPVFVWKKGGVSLTGSTDVRISGADTAKLTITGVDKTLDDAGAGSGYTCDITAGGETVTTDEATLLVNVAPTVTLQEPSSLSVNLGGVATFTVLVTGTPAPSFQWRKAGTNLSDGTTAQGSIISGATTATLTIDLVKKLDEAIGGGGLGYTCHVINSVGNDESAEATLVVNDPPLITEDPQSVTVNPDGSATFDVMVAGSAPLSYQWQRNLDVGGGGWEDIDGATGDSLVIDPVVEGAQGRYRVSVSNMAGQASSGSANLVVNDPVVIVTSPPSLTRDYHASASFSVLATGELTLYYLWKKDGVEVVSDPGRITGITEATLGIDNVEAADEGVYTCEVGNMVNSLTSDDAMLTVNDPAVTTQPLNASVLPGANAEFTVVAVGSGTLSYQWYKGTDMLVDGADYSGVNVPTLTVLDAQVGDQGEYMCKVAGDGGTADSDMATLTVTDPGILVQPQDLSVNPDDSATFSVELDPASTMPVTYQWRKNGVPIPDDTTVTTGSSGTLPDFEFVATLTILSAKQGDEGLYSCELIGAGAPVLTRDAAFIVYDPPVIDHVEVYPANGVVEIDSPAQFEVVMALSGHETAFSYQWKLNGVPVTGVRNITGYNADILYIPTAQVADEGNYTCEVTNSAGHAISDPPVFLAVGGAFLTITGQPGILRRYLGEKAKFEVVTTGGRPPNTYQWWFAAEQAKANTPVMVGTDAATYNTDALFSNAGSYWCEIKDLRKTYTSNTGTLEVANFLTIKTQPQSATRSTNESQLFSVATEGGFQPLTYAWHKQSAPETTLGTARDYTIGPLAMSDAGSYWVQVDDANTNVLVSNTAVLTIATSTPVAGLIGLGLLCGTLLSGGVFVVRRRK